MRAFNSSYVRYVRSFIQSLEKERTSALRRAPLSGSALVQDFIDSGRDFLQKPGILCRRQLHNFDEVGAFVIRPPIG